MRAHQVAYIEHKGEIPIGMIIRHTCDKPGCINPNHLLMGTHADNVADRVNRNRSAVKEQNGRSKLTIKNVEFIKKHNELSHAELARKFNVSARAITLIRTEVNWK